MAKKRGWFFGGGKKAKQTKWFKNFQVFFWGGGLDVFGWCDDKLEVGGGF